MIPDRLSVAIRSYSCARAGCDALVILPADTVARLRETHETFFCYRGHSQGFYGPSAEEKRRQQLEAELDASRRTARRLEAKAERLKRSRAAYKGRLTRTKNRVGKGVCPCCNRTFQNLARHMESKHPRYQESDL